MNDWLKRTWQAFRAWCRENEQAHRNAPVSPCCSAPPPGAGQRPHHDEQKSGEGERR
ncbi:hypothetical protein IAI53_01690 [Thauera sp. CAU 1555]|uniref:Uncharacterized protein n=1 Tax=Thauera sedimentorum TaxID=2767595 RepID=A0ABR9B5E9_9RHOO|nr:hypothetical protein [Thauera sedimentorum]MBC9070668.1 hypothetical protein [Thauera sedimentorum]MBD8501587.1 hypothetical protein [Thauera sedimentorum]